MNGQTVRDMRVNSSIANAKERALSISKKYLHPIVSIIVKMEINMRVYGRIM